MISHAIFLEGLNFPLVLKNVLGEGRHFPPKYIEMSPRKFYFAFYIMHVYIMDEQYSPWKFQDIGFSYTSFTT